MVKPSKKLILKTLDNPLIDLVRGSGYWYFVYDDPANNIFETHSVYCCYLLDLSLKSWVEEGQSLIDQIKK